MIPYTEKKFTCSFEVEKVAIKIWRNTLLIGLFRILRHALTAFSPLKKSSIVYAWQVLNPLILRNHNPKRKQQDTMTMPTL